MRHLLPSLFLLASLCCLPWASAVGAEQYQSPEAFVAESFGGTAPEPIALWITGNLRTQVKTILEHDPTSLRVHYWRKDASTVWVLEEIGKERPITTGWVVENDTILLSKVLAFRESRGWEVRQRFFTDQFAQASLDEKLELNQHIDGISGATLSVNAMRKMARLALLFHHQVMTDAGHAR